MRAPATLLARTALTLAASLLVLFLFSIAVMFYYVMGPMARQAAEDAAALLVLSAQTWAELPPETRADFEYELRHNHGILLELAPASMPPTSHWRPHMRLLKQALERRLDGQPVAIRLDADDDGLFWVEFEVAERRLRLGVPRHRITPHMPFALLWLVSGGLLVLLVTSLVVVRRITAPLERMSEAVTRFGRGERTTLAEDGPLELQRLARSFNEMTRQVDELLANRTTLLAGISHDLRTPIARLTLALELLPADADPDLLARMRNDLREMDGLITRTLELARSLDHHSGERQRVDLGALLAQIAGDYSPGAVRRRGDDVCEATVDVAALKRVITNLLDNALRYGGEPVELVLHCEAGGFVIDVLDRGPGIPAPQLDAVFQPFYRLESSRSTTTGGSGLGLAIVRQLAHANGWSVTLMPRASGGLRARVASGSGRDARGY